MTMKNLKIFALTSIIIFFSGLFIMATSQKEQDTPVGNFEYFWKIFDTHYGLFEAKGIDWNEMHTRFRPRVNEQTTDEQLYHVFTEMIAELNDNHVTLYPTNGDLPAFPGGVLRYTHGKLTILKAQDDYDLAVVKNYVKDLKEVTGSIRYGHLSDNIGYINFGSHTDSRKDVEEIMDRIMQALKDTKGIVVDVRGDYGGHDAIAQYMAGNFTAETKLYMTTRKRNGPRHSDFTSPLPWHAEPRGHFPYTKPVALLTSRFTQSAGETFTLAMKEFDHVTIMGDTTAGSYSDNPTTELPNGWMLSLSVGDYRAADGKSYEGIGTSPDIWMRTSKEELLAGKDTALEKALLKLLN
jgi:carboxyl-terminal processing protease